MAVSDWNTTPALNTSISGINIAEGCAPGNLNDAIRQMMADLKTAIAASSAFPAGGIVMWSGSVAAIPSGWALCDGTSGTPDLRNRFVVGAGSTYTVGNSGGSTTKTIAEANLPAHTHGAGTLAAVSGGAHTHTGSTDSAGAHTHTFQQNTSGTSGTNVYSTTNANSGNTNLGSMGMTSAGAHTHTLTIDSGGAHTHTISGATGATGSGTALDIMPPYYALAYIMKL